MAERYLGYLGWENIVTGEQEGKWGGEVRNQARLWCSFSEGSGGPYRRFSRRGVPSLGVQEDDWAGGAQTRGRMEVPAAVLWGGEDWTQGLEDPKGESVKGEGVETAVLGLRQRGRNPM